MIIGRRVASTTRFGAFALALTCVLLLSIPAWAQQSPAGIAGVVRDTSGGVLPGVTVEAASPALIEKVRTVVTDGEGRYNIVDLRLGTYTVTFTLPGFNTFKREGIELTSGFTATVNADMRVGALEETVTVTGAAPLVDTQNVRQQKVVSNELLNALPTGQLNLTTLVTFTPGLAGGVANVGGAKGTWDSTTSSMTFHGKAGVNTQYDGMRIQNMAGGAPGYMFNTSTIEEMSVETGGLSAASPDASIVTNLIPKEGSNSFKFGATGMYTNTHLQSDNLTDALRARGLTTVDHINYMYDNGGTVGGPIRKDRLWFFGAVRWWGNSNQIAGRFWNKTQNTPVYTPDLTRPASRFEVFRSYAGRVTWQASPRNKVNIFIDVQKDCICVYNYAGKAIEAASWLDLFPQGIVQGTWSAPLTSRLLLEGGAAASSLNFPERQQSGVTLDSIPTLEQSTGIWYNAPPYVATSMVGHRRSPNLNMRYSQRFSISYVTGSHTFKVGVQPEEGTSVYNVAIINNGGVQHEYLRGVPVAVGLAALPWRNRVVMKADLGIYAQDQWAVKRWTVNYGLRFAYVNWYVPAQHLDAGRFVPARDYAAVHKVPEWKDVLPRLGASYDLRGTGRTAIKVSVGRYGDLTARNPTALNDPVIASVSVVNRPWTDTNRDYVPDCLLTNFAANGECGPIVDQNFGKADPKANQYADDVLHGWGARFYTWDVVTEVQQQLGHGLSMTGGYSRSWSGNFTVTDNLAVTAADYSPYCITAPTDSRLPGGGGYQVCGPYDVNPDKFGKVTNLVAQASHYGKQTRVSNFVYGNMNARFSSGIQLGGGVDIGRVVDDKCFVVDSPQQLLYCHVVPPWSANLQVKLNGTVPLPVGFLVSGTFLNVPGLALEANYPATSAEIAPSLGRPLAGSVRTAIVPLIAPQTQFEARRTQLDLRLAKIFRLGATARLQANFDVYNALNASTIQTVNNTVGSQWLRPFSILDGRLIQLGGNLSF